MQILKFTGEYVHWHDNDGKIVQSFSARCAPLKPVSSGLSVSDRRAIRSGDYTLVPASADQKSMKFEWADAADKTLTVVVRNDKSVPAEENVIHIDDELFGMLDRLLADDLQLRVSYEQSHFMKTTVTQPGR